MTDRALPRQHNLPNPDVYADHIQDVNGDGWMNLVSHYAQKDTGLAPGMTYAWLDGKFDGIDFSAYDSVRVLAK